MTTITEVVWLCTESMNIFVHELFDHAPISENLAPGKFSCYMAQTPHWSHPGLKLAPPPSSFWVKAAANFQWESIYRAKKEVVVAKMKSKEAGI